MRTTRDKKEERGRERKERIKETKRWIDRQYKKRRERNDKPRKKHVKEKTKQNQQK